MIADGKIKVYFADESMSEEHIDALLNKFGGEIEAALDQVLDEAKRHLAEAFPRGLLRIETEV